MYSLSKGDFVTFLLLATGFVDGASYAASEPLAKKDDNSFDAKSNQGLFEKQKEVNLIMQNTIEGQQADNKDIKRKLKKEKSMFRGGHDKRKSHGSFGCNPFLNDGGGKSSKGSKGGKFSCAYSCYPGMDGDACNDGSTLAEIGKAACNGSNACVAVTGEIGDGSCVGYAACQNKAETIEVGEGSCVGYLGCAQVGKGIVGDGSCVGDYACDEAIEIIVGDRSCLGADACEYAEAAKVENDSCLGYEACDSAKRIEVGNGSCYGEHACFESKETKIGDNSCEGANSCSEMDPLVNVGHNSCVGVKSCMGIGYSVGEGSCNCDGCCQGCEKDVPAGECNDPDQTTCPACELK
jgi:hypothetical protein